MFSHTPLLIIISNLSTALPFLSASWLFTDYPRYRFLLPLWCYFTLAFATEVVVHIFHLLGQPNAWLIHVYTPLELTLILYILSRWQRQASAAARIRRLIPLYWFIYLALKLSGTEQFQADTINYISRPVSLLMLITGVFYTLHLLWSSLPGQLRRDYRFWILLAMAIYYSGSIIIVAFMFIKSPQILLALVNMHALLNIAHNALFTGGVLYALRYVPANLIHPPG